jgi:hypothetical protein
MTPDIIDPLPHLESLIQTHDSLQASLSQAPERLRPTYEIAAAAAHAALQESLKSESVQARASELDTQFQADVVTISELAQQGLLTEEQAEAELRRISTHPDYRLLRIVRGLGGPIIAREAAAEDTAPNPETTAVAVEPIKPVPIEIPGTGEHNSIRDNLSITISDQYITVNGALFPDTIYGASKDRKIAFLQAIAKLNPGDKFSANELWDLTFPGRPFERDDMSVFRNWVEQHTITKTSGQPLLIHNRKRGPISAYTYNQAVQLTLVDERSDVKPSASSPVSRSVSALTKPRTETHTEDIIDYRRAPNTEEMRYIRVVISELARQAGDDIDMSKIDPALLENPDISGKTTAELACITASTLLRIQAIGESTDLNKAIFEKVTEDGGQLIRFLNVISPIIRQYAPIIKDKKEMRRIAGEVLGSK